MPRIVTCLWFESEAEEAATFYTKVFPHSEITSVTRYGPGMPLPEGTVLTAEFTLDGQPYLALNGGSRRAFSEAMSLQIACGDQADVDHYWDGLIEGGGAEGRCGWLTDRYGVSWQVVPAAMPELLGDADPGRAERAMHAMMGMTRIDVAAMRRAADGVLV